MKLLHVDQPHPNTNDPFHELAASIIGQAVEDYRKLGAKLLDAASPIEKKRISEEMKSISRFFLSDWYCILSGYENGSKILGILEREVFGDD